jgi:hypothetical protein
MPFEPLTKAAPRARTRKPISAVQVAHRKKTGITEIRVTSQVTQAMGFDVNDEASKVTLAILIGTDDDQGLVQIRQAVDGDRPVRPTTISKGNFSVRISPANIKGAGNNGRAMPASFSVENKTLTVELPSPPYTVAEAAKGYLGNHGGYVNIVTHA